MKKIIILVFVFLVFGCDDDGRVGGTRTACRIEGGTNGSNTAWFRYFDYADQPITQTGLRMNYTVSTPFYFKNNGVGGLECVATDFVIIKSTGITEEGGMCYGKGNITESGYSANDSHANRVYSYFSKPKSESCECSAEMAYIAVPYTNYALCGVQVCSTVPKWVQQAAGETAMLTPEEMDAVSESEPALPESGLSYSLCLVQQRGNLGAGYAAVMDGLVPFNLDTYEDVFLKSYPVQYSYTIRTAQPVELLGREFLSRIKTD